ncbi:hypothetical protein BGZ54_008822 [Gamsiella multidivaricata]|nr:hypothetical protein BGZ54_008822 [Gamsiella multidivaricata]
MYSVGSFFSTVTKFYNEINPATLSGAIDIVVVEQADGDLACSPFHVRFGKLSVLRPQEKVVEVRVNGEVIPFPMKVGDAGEAFFVLETNDYVPDEFATSPIAGPTDETDLAPVDYFDLNGQHRQQQGHQKLLEGTGGEYPQADEDTLLDNGYVSAASGHGSAFEESFKDDSDHDSVSSFAKTSVSRDTLQDMPGSFSHTIESLQEPESPLPTEPSPSRPRPTRDEKPSQEAEDKEASTATADTSSKDDISFPTNVIFPTVVHQSLPNGTREDGVALGNSHGTPRTRRKSEVLLDMTGYKTDSCSESSDDEDDLPRGILSDSERHHRGLRKRFGRKSSHLSKEQRQQLLDDIRQGVFMKPEENFVSTQMERQDVPFPTIARNVERLKDPQPKNAAVAAEVLPKREQRPSVMSDTEMEYETGKAPASIQGKQWTWGWGSLPVKQDNPDEDDEIKEEALKPMAPEVPVEIETKEFQMGSVTCHVALSLCGEEEFGKDLAAGHKAFQNAQLTFEAFTKDPAAVLADKRLVCYMDGRFYTWNNAVPQLVSLLFFHQPLADTASHDLKDQKALTAGDRPTSTRFGTISRWFRKTPAGSNSSPSTPDVNTAATTVANDQSGAVAVGSDDDDVRPVNKALRSKSLPPLETGRENGHAHTHAAVPALSEKSVDGSEDKKRYAKTLRLTSEQLRSLNLKKGANTVSFSVSSAYQGTATCVAKIFLWDYDAQVVISDIDGTITKSDALGHIFAMAGRDWTHLGVAKLFTDIRSNGYHILYLTSRAIGQADYTRKYLQKVEQNSYQLPDGPVIMSPDRLFSAFHREVIIRKPEVFKMACLRDVKKLFGDRNPFYAGFGNRITDALSYRSVNVPPSRIFTIDSYGEVKLELLSAFKSSYLALNDLVNEIFPGQRVAPEFNDWNYWKADLPKIELPDLPIAPNNYGMTSSSASLLSSTTSVAKRVVLMTHSSSSNSLQPISPTAPSADSKSKRASYERGSYTGALLRRQESPTSDEEGQDQHQGQEDGASQTDGQSLRDSRKIRANSPSMLSALVPTRLIRAVRSGSGSASSQATHVPQPTTVTATSTPHSPEMAYAGEEVVRPVSIPSPPPLDGLLQTNEDVAKSSKNSLDQHVAHRTGLTDDLVSVKQEEEDEDAMASRLLQRPSEGFDEALLGDEEEYQGDYEDGEYGDEEDQDDEDDEYLDQIEEGLEEPFL